tara:strand:- start:21 stop:170 length:150 start_codon:yes stop_codon:yes gene_type:complete
VRASRQTILPHHNLNLPLGKEAAEHQRSFDFASLAGDDETMRVLWPRTN